MRSVNSAVKHPLLQPMVLLTVGGLVLAVALHLMGRGVAVAMVACAVVGIAVVVALKGMLRDFLAGHWGLDVLAVVAMVATLAVQEYLAGLIIAVMLTGGEALEDLAAARASQELDLLISRRPASAHREREDGTIEQVSTEEVAVGDVLIVRSGEVVPVDGILLSETAVIDESTLTGEPIPVTRNRGEAVTSGTTNGTTIFRMEAMSAAADSRYAQIVQLVEQAVESKSPMVRLADRYAVPFTAASLLIAGIAWFVSKDATRFAEVLVVATPCPLLIGAPIAFLGGMSSAARANVIIKDSGTLERLARIRTAVFDKTGTLTQGAPQVVEVLPASGSAERVLQLAASAEQFSMHVFAGPIVEYARGEGVELLEVEEAREVATQGVEARVGGQLVRVGKRRFIGQVAGVMPDVELAAGQSAVYVAASSEQAGAELVGVIVLADPIRADAAATVKQVRELGAERVLMVTGDVRTTAVTIATQVGITDVHAEVSPEGKFAIVEQLPGPTLMVGDGINDAPVLAAADVGIAMGAGGASVATESADAIIIGDGVSAVADAAFISQRTIRIALQSIWFGITISVGLMFVAAFGYLPAVVGALLQEVVDVVAIVVALQALRIPAR